jgi:hypothetical protein
MYQHGRYQSKLRGGPRLDRGDRRHRLGLFFLWVGIALVASVGWGIALLGTGVITLGVQFARRVSGLPVDRWGVGFGACLSVAGLTQWLDVPLGTAPLPAWAVPAAFAALGIAIPVSTWGAGADRRLIRERA